MARRTLHAMSGDARCVGCGCSDSRACGDAWAPCYWLKVDHALKFGVCSACPDKVATYDRQHALAKGGRHA